MRLVSLFMIQLIITLFFPSYVLSQVNIEKFRESKDVKGFSGHFELDFSSRSGNVDITKLDIESYSNYLWESMNTFLVIRGDYGWQGGKEFSNEGLVHLRHIFRSGADFQPEIFTQIDYNQKSLMLTNITRMKKNRMLSAGAITYQQTSMLMNASGGR